MYTPQQVCSKMCTLMSKIHMLRTHLHKHECSGNIFFCGHIYHNKMKIHPQMFPCKSAVTFVAMETIAKILETCASIVQAVVCWTPTCYPDALGRPTTARQAQENNSKSTPAHDVVAATLSHKHHPIIHGWMMLIYGSGSPMTQSYSRHSLCGLLCLCAHVVIWKQISVGVWDRVSVCVGEKWNKGLCLCVTVEK